MEHSLHYLLLYDHAVFQKRIMQQLSGSGLTLGQPKVLDYLLEHDGCIQKELAAACQIDAATIVGLLNRMEEIGLLERRQENGDRRAFSVYLTQKGIKKAEEVQAGFRKIEALLLAEFSESEQKALTDLLYKLRESARKTES